MLALFSCSLAMAQNEKTDQNIAQGLDENAFTFSEAQLGEDDDMSSNVTILNSTSNVYASQAGYLFSPARFRYRAFNQKYNDVYINGASMNDMETVQFRFSNIGGLNARLCARIQTLLRGHKYALFIFQWADFDSGQNYYLSINE